MGVHSVNPDEFITGLCINSSLVRHSQCHYLRQNSTGGNVIAALWLGGAVSERERERERV